MLSEALQRNAKHEAIKTSLVYFGLRIGPK